VVVGDRVEIAANAPTSGTVLLAVKVEAAPASTQKPTSSQLGLVGTVASVSATTINVTIRVANDAATTWLAANANPTVVTVDVSTARIEREAGGSLAVADKVAVHATAPASGTILVGTFIEASPSTPGPKQMEAKLELQGVVDTAGTSTATVRLLEVNKAAKTWLLASGNPTTVTVDLSSASIRRSGGGSLQSGDKVEIKASVPTTGLILKAQSVEASPARGESHPAEQVTFAGTIFKVGLTSIEVTLTEVSNAAKTYLAANGNPTVVTVSVSTASVHRDHGGTLSVGDAVVVTTPTPASGTVFLATRLVAEPASHSHGEGH
jgi:hypothetical protein